MLVSKAIPGLCYMDIRSWLEAVYQFGRVIVITVSFRGSLDLEVYANIAPICPHLRKLDYERGRLVQEGEEMAFFDLSSDHFHFLFPSSKRLPYMVKYELAMDCGSLSFQPPSYV